VATASSRVTAESARFMNALVALEPETEDSGIYGDKPGYHGTRAENIERDGENGDYSVRAPLDKQGPADKGAAYDWTHHKAQRGDYSSMAKYGRRLRAAFDAKDPRLFGWREALGQTDLDAAPEGLDFQGWYTRVPDGTHSWHWHLSELRAFVASWDNKACMLSVLSGETLAAYLARGGRLVGAMADSVQLTTTNWRLLHLLNMKEVGDNHVNDTAEEYPLVTWLLALGKTVATVLAQVNSNGAGITALKAEVAALRQEVADLAEVPVTMTPADVEAVAASVVAKLGPLRFDPHV
jgi:hypothetical protein